jgi:hypothetical protein
VISDKILQEFKAKGFCLLENSFPQPLLRQWRELTLEIEKECLKKHEQGIIQTNVGMSVEQTGPKLLRYNDVYQDKPELTYTTLSSDILLNLMKTFCGKSAVPLQMDVVYKQQYPQPVTRWHQDALHNREFPYINIGIYLDDAHENDGCLTYVPESQKQAHNIQALAEEYGWDIPGAIDVPAKAGDIVVHDMMTLHGSKPKRSAGVRRTLYIEVRPWQGIIDAGQQSKLWSDLRQQWMAAVLKYDHKNIWPPGWKDEHPAPAALHSLLATIAQKREAPAPSIWENFQVEKPGYPIPKDMENIK